jgi:hypothetical protein
MSNNEIIETLRVTLAQLSVLNKSNEFQKIEHSRFYSTTNDVFLGDAINTISEVISAVENVQKV